MADPDTTEIDLLRRIHRGGLSPAELEEMADRFADRYRVQVALIQNPRFPVRRALNFIPSLFPADLMRLIRNKMANPQLRRRAELEFFTKFRRFPLGEKITFARMAPVELLRGLIESKDQRILEVILQNANCTQEVVMTGLLRDGDRESLFAALNESRWVRQPGIASLISRQPDAPIKILMSVIPWLNSSDLERLESASGTHESILRLIRNRREGL